jgi:hypothetical protein
VAGEEDDDASKVKEQLVAGPVVCRASFNGMWVSGELRPEHKSCIVSFLGVKKGYERYQVLENVDNGSSLDWVRWNKFSQIPTGAVACGDDVETFIARRKEESNTVDDMGGRFTHHIGKLDPKDGLGKISIVNKVGLHPELAPQRLTT